MRGLISLLIALPFSGCIYLPGDDDDDDDDGSGEEMPDVGDFVLEWGEEGDYGAFADWSKDGMSGEDDYLNETYRLPVDLPIRHEACGEETAYWYEGQVTMCYELQAMVVDLWMNGLPDGSEEEILGASFTTWIFILYHELGHGLVETYELPVPGREEDAADAFSAVALVDRGAPDAVVFAAIFWYLLGEQGGGELNYADEHSLDMQRFYNLLCWVYGYDPDEYDYLVEYFPEMEDRIAGGRCEAEYAQQADSWHELLEAWYQ